MPIATSRKGKVPAKKKKPVEEWDEPKTKWGGKQGAKVAVS